MDLCEKAVAAVKAGASQKQTAEFLEIGVETLRRWQAKERASECLAPNLSRPGPCGVFEDTRPLERSLAQLQADPDGRLVDHCRRWQEAMELCHHLDAIHLFITTYNLAIQHQAMVN